jgi:3-deoxy-D-manno-octulosonic-acid transferase
MNFFYLLLYNLGIRIYAAGISIASLWNSKAKRWINGRKGIIDKMKQQFNENESYTWFHCASTGEFEQGRPLIAAYRKRWPDHKILLTFFSPSGFELRKNYAGADCVYYLPIDTASNAAQFIGLVKPRLAIFVKYEFWYHFLKELQQQQIPALLISATFRKEQLFFKWYGSPWRNVLHRFQHLFLQDTHSLQLLESISVHHTTVSGDTRFDRVTQIAQESAELHIIKDFKGTNKLFVAGSTWPEDEQLLSTLIHDPSNSWKWVIVPHEISKHHLEALRNKFKEQAVFYSLATKEELAHKSILIVDAVGLLSSIYRYADMAYIGGGFGKGIHNILEAAVFGIPVLFGPNYHKFNEAKDLLTLGAAASVHNGTTLTEYFLQFSRQPHSFASVNRNYINQQKGATEKIMHYLAEIN